MTAVGMVAERVVKVAGWEVERASEAEAHLVATAATVT